MSTLFKTIAGYHRITAIILFSAITLFSCSKDENSPELKFIDTQAQIAVNASASSVDIKFTSSDAWTAELKLTPSTSTWATANKLGGNGGTETNTVTVSLEPNLDTENERVVNVTFSYGGAEPRVIKITQEKYKNTLTLIDTQSAIAVDASATSVDIKFTSTAAWMASLKLAPSTPVWATTENKNGDGGKQTNTITVKLDPNTDTENEREVIVSISFDAGEPVLVTITQGKAILSLVDTQSAIVVNAATASLNLQFTSSAAWTVELEHAPLAPVWATTENLKGDGGTETNNIEITLEPNSDTENDRVVNAIISNGNSFITVSITQTKAGVNLVDTELEMMMSATTVNVEIKFTSSSNWTTQLAQTPSSPIWATLETQSGNGGEQVNTIIVVLEPNDDTENSRVATITISDGSDKAKTIKITQSKYTNLPAGFTSEKTSNGFTLGLKDGAQIDAVAKSKLISDLANLSSILSSNIISQLNATPILITNDGKNSYFEQNSEMEYAGYIVLGDLAKYNSAVVINQPMLIMNLFARSSFDKLFTEANRQETIAVFNKVKATKYAKNYYSLGVKYDILKVYPDAGKRVPDAAKDAISYFAEITEAYFGMNDFYPIDIMELKRYDLAGYELTLAAWGDRVIEENPYGITLPPTSLTQWLNFVESPLDPFYSKYLMTESGLPIVASRFVKDKAIVQAGYIIDHMVSRVPESVTAMLEDNFRIGIVGVNEKVTDLPEIRMMNIWWPDTDWDARARGYGATTSLPIMSCGEENIIEGMTDRYFTESIMVHEFAHNVDHGLRKGRDGWEKDLIAAYDAAMASGKWKGAYASTNSVEYFAVGVQAWFDTADARGIAGYNGSLVTRAQLKAYDKTLYDLIATVMPEEFLEGYHFTKG